MQNVTLNRSTRTASFRSFGVAPEVSDLSPFAFQKAIGLDWEVEKEGLTFGMLETAGLEDLRAVVRQDNRKALGVVGKDYAPVQNGELFQFFADMAEFDLGVKFVAGGALGRGETVWTLARVPSMRHVLNGDDILDTFVGVSNGHGGNATLKVDIYTFRKICSNGMHGLTRTKAGETTIGKGWNLKHTTGISDRFAQAQSVLRCIAADHAATMEAAERLAAIPATFDTVEATCSRREGRQERQQGPHHRPEPSGRPPGYLDLSHVQGNRHGRHPLDRRQCRNGMGGTRKHREGRELHSGGKPLPRKLPRRVGLDLQGGSLLLRPVHDLNQTRREPDRKVRFSFE